jgi:hypothetical protein
MRFAKVLCLFVICLLVVVGLYSVRCGESHRAAATTRPATRQKPRTIEAGPPRGPVAEAPKPPLRDDRLAEKPAAPEPPKATEKAPAPQAQKGSDKAPAAGAKTPPPAVEDIGDPPPVVDVIDPDAKVLPPDPGKAKPADAKGPPWTVTGRGADQPSADETALEKARDRVIVYLRTQDPPINWQPSLAYVQQNLAKKDPEQPKEVDDPILGKVHERTLRVDVDAKHFREMVEMDRLERMEERELLLAKVLGGILGLLTAVFGYYKLDEMTKGYYTGWLRVAAVALVLAVGATLFLVA